MQLSILGYMLVPIFNYDRCELPAPLHRDHVTARAKPVLANGAAHTAGTHPAPRPLEPPCLLTPPAAAPLLTPC